MKQIYKFLLLLLVPVAALAQPTITQADLPVPGVTWTGYLVSPGGPPMPITPAGPAQVWNFSSLFNQASGFTYQFLSPSAIPSSLSQYYPGANLVLYTPSQNFVSFYKTQSTGFYVDGSLGLSTPGDTSVQDFSPDLMIVPVPFAYQNTHTSGSKLVMTNLLMGEKYVTHYQRTITADAYGSLTLPSGTFPNTLRSRQSTFVIDSSFLFQNGNWVFDAVESDTFPDYYTWFRNSQPNFMLLEAQENPQTPGFAYPSSMVYYTGSSLSAPNALSVARVQPYPNPASTMVSFPIESPGAVRLIISDAAGREVASEPVRGINQLRFSTAHLPAGVYAYRVTGTEGATLQQGRFTVLK